MQKALRHTVIINFSHYVQQKLLFRWFKSSVCQQHFGAYSRCERRYPYIKGCNSGAPQKVLWEQIVACSAHSKKHFKTNLAEYWGGGGFTVGQVTSRTIFLPSASESNTLVVCLTRLSQPQFCTELFWSVSVYSYQRLGCRAILVLLPRLILVGHKLMRPSDGALRCVAWNFGMWEVL